MAILVAATNAGAQGIYLSSVNMSVELGEGMAAEPFANLSTAASLENIIDLPTADSGELHTQAEHVWINGGTLSVVFDLQGSRLLTDFHFWNYHGESFDVDRIELDFIGNEDSVVGSMVVEDPPLGNGTGSDSDPIFADTFPINLGEPVTEIRALLSGTNGQVDFNNMGFTAVCLADVNQDGQINGSDFFAWVNAFGTGGTGCEQNLDGVCNASDFFAWVAAFGDGCAAPARFVPPPATPGAPKRLCGCGHDTLDAE